MEYQNQINTKSNQWDTSKEEQVYSNTCLPQEMKKKWKRNEKAQQSLYLKQL